jgi:hypothetical protein
MIKNQFLMGMLLSLLMVSVQTNAVITTASTPAPYCPAPGELSLKIADQALKPEFVDFDEITTYSDESSDSIPLMVKKAVGGANFKFYSYDKDLKNLVERECLSSGAN